MELLQESRAVCLPQAVLDTVAEQLADVDVTLPDYCPDIEKILKCTLTPKIQNRALSGGQLQIEGCCVVNVMYLEGEKKTVRCCEQNVNWSQSFAVRDTPENCVILTKTKSEYINCRALSPRRLVIHGAFSLYAKVIAPKKITLYTPEDQDLELCRQPITCSALCSLCQEQFTVSEEIAAGDKPAVESLLYSSVDASVTDVKAITGKLMLNGEISVRMFYLTDVETGQTAKTEYVVPFSQVLDCEGAEEESKNMIDCEVLSYDIRLKNDVLSEKPVIALDAKLCVTVEGHVQREEYVITDAYSTQFAAETEEDNISYIAGAEPVDESFIEKYSAKIDNCQIQKLLDVYSEHITMDSQPTQEGLEVNGKINLCMMALDGDGTPVLIERSFDYSHTISSEGCNALLMPKIRMASVSYRLADGNSIELRCELKLTAGAVKNASRRTLRSVNVLRDKPLESDDCALSLYFASQGESLWRIAKEHRTRLSLLQAENEAAADVLESDCMLLIPKI
ncbi:MAG: DUF3794 domain-containing protein [Ruminococcus sp.]|nr:DUF3794 domain-containing protein [Ruminococcus sp.]